MRKALFYLALYLMPFPAVAQTTISALPAAAAMSGSEVAPVVQSGTTKKATATAIANTATAIASGATLGTPASITLTNATGLPPGALPVGSIAVANIAALTGSNYSALKAAGGTVQVLGYTTAGDGGGGTFYSASSCPNGADGGTGFQDSAGNWWCRQLDPQQTVNSLMFGDPHDGTNDSTPYWTSAVNASSNVVQPPAKYSLNNFSFTKAGQSITCAGLGGKLGSVVSAPASWNSCIVYQRNAANPAINIVSNVTTGQLLNINLSGLMLVGAASSSAPCLNMAATTPYVITASNVNVHAQGCYNSIKAVSGTSANEIFANHITLYQSGDPTSGSYNTNGSLSTGVIITRGVYNVYDFYIGNPATGVGLIDTSTHSFYNNVYSQGQLNFSGNNQVINNATVESITGGANVTCAIYLNGQSMTVNGVSVITVSNATAQYGICLNGGGGASYVINGFSVGGTYPGTAPLNPMQIPSGNSGFVSSIGMGTSMAYVEATAAAADLRNFTFVGGGLNCGGLSALYCEYPRTGSATATAGAASSTATVTTITTESLTTAAAATYTLTLTNAKIAATSNVLVSLANGTNTTKGAAVFTVTPGAGSVAIVIANNGSAALNGTLVATVEVKN